MFFTQEDYRKIEKWLLSNSRKDTDFVGAATPLKGNETVVLVQNGKNVKTSVKDIVDQFFLLGVSDFLNITDKYGESYISLTQAIQLIPFRSRKVGQVVTFIDESGNWAIYQFQGKALNQWNNTTLWIDLLAKISGIPIIDSEDITTKENGAKQVSLYLADKQYNEADYSGLGRIYLRKNIQTVIDPSTGAVINANLLTQSMLAKENTIYIIQYDYNLNNQTITIPDNCVLQFEGGSIRGGTINFSNTSLSGDINITSNVTGNILNSFANIVWFGAKENTDSTSAIQNAINVCNRVYIPKVSEGALFIIQEDIYINKPTQIYGELGNKIGNLEDITTLTLFKVINTEYVYFYNLNLTNGTASTERVTGETSGAINIDNCTNITIDNCKIDNIFGHWGVKVRNTTNIKVEYTSFSNITYNMLFFEEGCRNILVNNCSFINVTSLYEADRKYMVSTGVTNYTDQFPIRVDNFKVTNCYFENNSFWEAIDSHGGTNIIIENNIIKDCAIGIAVNADNRPALSIPTDNVIIQNNYIKGWENKINYFGINATSGVYDYFGTNYHIANNIVIDYNTDNNNISGAIRLVGLRNATVINNTVRGTSNVVNRIYNGIHFVTCLDSIISENNVSNCVYGIRCGRASYNIKVTSNIFKDLDLANISINGNYSGLLDISGNITTPTNSGAAIFTNSTNCTGIKTNWILGRKGFFIRTLDQRPLFAYTHDNLKRDGSTVNVLLTVSSTGELRVKDETVDLLRYIAESESLTLNSNNTNYPVIIGEFTSPYKAQILNWTGGDVEIESITYDTCECVSVTSEVKDSVENLNNVFVGYDYFNKATNQVMTKDNTGNWLNMDGSSYNKVKIIYDKSFISDSGQNKILKIVSDIDLAGETLTIPKGCTLDFQGGSFSNGMVVGQNTKISGNTIGIFDESVTISGIWNIERISSKFFKTLNNDNSLRNVINLSNSSICNEIIIEEGVYYFNFETNYEAGLTINSNTSLIINGSLNVKPNRFPNYYVIRCNEVENITIKGNGSIIGDKDGHLYDEWEYESTHEWGHGVGVTKSNNILIHGLNISKCTGDGISITGEKNIIEYCNIFDCRRQGISFTKGKDLIIRNCEIYDIYVNDGTPPGAAIDIEPDSSGVVNGCSKVIIENCNFYNCNYGILIYSVSYYLGDFYLRNNIIDNVLNSCIALDASATTKGYPITNVFIEGNKLSNANYKSLFITSCENLIVQNNTIIEKTGATAYPIEIRNTTLCNISDNIINSSNLWNIYKCNININNNIFNNTNIENSSGYIPIKTINIVETVPSGSSFIELNDVPIIFFGNTFNNYIINSKLNCHIKSNIINIDCVHTYHDWNVANFIVEDNDYNLINNVYVNSPFFSISGSCVAIFNNNRFTVINNAVNRIIYSTVGNSVSLNGNVFKGNTSANYSLTYPYILNYKTIYANYVYKGSSSGKPNLTENDFGFIYLDQTINRPIYWNGVNWIDFEGGNAFYKIRGTTENRPTLMAEDKGYQYYDTTLNKWINWTGTAWTNLDGTPLT